MEHFLYSIHATFPIFLVMLVGWVLKQVGMLNDEFCKVANRFNFKVTLPILLFLDIADMDIRAYFDPRYLAFCAGVTTFCFVVIWALTEKFMKDEESKGAFVQGSFRGSAAVLGAALILNIYEDVGPLPLMIIGSVPLYNIFSVIVLTFKARGEMQGQGSARIRAALIGICKNPLIWGIVLGLPFSVWHLPIPVMIEKTLSNFSAMSTPLALVVIGASFEGAKALAKVRPTLIAALIKLVIQPAIFLPLAIAMGFRDQALVALLIMLGAPTTPSTYIMAQSMNNDDVLAASIIVVTILASSVTITGWLFWMSAIGVV